MNEQEEEKVSVLHRSLLPLPSGDETIRCEAWPKEIRGKSPWSYCKSRLAARARIDTLFEAYMMLVLPQALADEYSRSNDPDLFRGRPEVYAFTEDVEWETLGFLLVLGYRPRPEGGFGRRFQWKEDFDALCGQLDVRQP
ncbi:hypothetical protein IY145_21185 [Methylosinus sp. H3A]|nr:hypothetical protein [Methylosinus sp. H3A]